jgi:electron transfer flavoprotein alpha subunit
VANILTYIELVDNEASRGSLMALNRGRQVASQLGATLYAVLPCASTPSYDEEDIIAVLSRHGADKVILISHPRLGPPAFYATHGEALLTACKQFPPRIMLFPSSAESLDLAPRIAVALRAHFVADARVDLDGETLHVARSMFRRQFVSRESIADSDQPVGATLNYPGIPEVFGDDEAEVVVIHGPVEGSPPLEVLDGPTPAPQALTSARTVAVGGGGVGDKKTFALVERLAEQLGGAAGASRTACSEGLADPDLQVGLDGVAVEADLYLAFGVSGSEHHLAGLSPATEVVAINTDSEAPIFGASQYAMVADARQTLVDLLKLLEEDPQGEPE